MKKITTLLFFYLLTVNATAQTPLHNFDELMSALKAGKTVKAVIYYGKCKLFSDGVEEAESPNAIGGMKLDTYEYFDSSVFHGKVPSFVTSSQTVLINQNYYGYVYNYVKIKAKVDNSVEITARYLKPRKFSSKFKIVMDETFKGQINDGTNDGAVLFFVE
ncbi:VirK family protein [Flavobacterium sp.]|uniref:VirK family protein n=1 Tax=Flavobacterium sp. TaxID=239 RepID=UPI002FD8E0CF